MSLPPLKQVITADTGPFDKALGQSQARLATFSKAGAAALAAVGAALVAMTRRSMQNIDAMTKQARSVGLTTRALQAMSLVASEAGVSTQSLTQSLGLMQRQIVELERGSVTATRAFNDIGMSLKDLQGLEPDEQFRRIAESLNRIQDPARRTAAAMEIFGRSGRQVINMLDDYGTKIDEAREFQERFGIAISQTDAEAIERANDAIGRVREAFGGLGNLLAVRFAPAIERVSRAFLSIAGVIADRLRPGMQDYESAADDARAAQVALNEALKIFHETAAPEAAKNATVAAQAYREQAAAARDAAAAELAKAEAELAGFTVRGGAAGAMAGAMDPARRQGLIDTETKARENLAAATEALARANDMARAAATRVTGGGILLGGPETDDDPPVAPGVGGAGAVRDAMGERLEALRDALATESEVVAAWYAESLATLNDALAERRITEEDYHDLRERLEKEHQDRLNQIREAGGMTGLEVTKSVMGSMLQVAQAGGDRLIKAQKAISAALAAINVYEGITKALTLPWPQNFAVAAQTAAQGFAAIARLQSVSRGNTGGGAAGAPAAAPAIPRQNIIIDLVGDTFGRNSVQSLFEEINRGLRSGYQIEGVLVR